VCFSTNVPVSCYTCGIEGWAWLEVIIVIMLVKQAVASMRSTPRPTKAEGRGSTAPVVCKYYAHPLAGGVCHCLAAMLCGAEGSVTFEAVGCCVHNIGAATGGLVLGLQRTASVCNAVTAAQLCVFAGCVRLHLPHMSLASGTELCRAAVKCGLRQLCRIDAYHILGRVVGTTADQIMLQCRHLRRALLQSAPRFVLFDWYTVWHAEARMRCCACFGVLPCK
jgi:hypothetical protein